jgi:hypothetical protein
MDAGRPERDPEPPEAPPRAPPLLLLAPAMLVAAAAAAGAGFLAYRFFAGALWGLAGIVIGLIAAGAAATVLAASVWERLAVRRWRRWRCPSCGAPYRPREYSEVALWSARDGPAGARGAGGVILRCPACGREGRFLRSGEVVRDEALLAGFASAAAARAAGEAGAADEEEPSEEAAEKVSPPAPPAGEEESREPQAPESPPD